MNGTTKKELCGYKINEVVLSRSMDLIPYSFAPLILFLIPYTLDLLP